MPRCRLARAVAAAVLRVAVVADLLAVVRLVALLAPMPQMHRQRTELMVRLPQHLPLLHLPLLHLLPRRPVLPQHPALRPPLQAHRLQAVAVVVVLPAVVAQVVALAQVPVAPQLAAPTAPTRKSN